jgi:hypothetical protein
VLVTLIEASKVLKAKAPYNTVHKLVYDAFWTRFPHAACAIQAASEANYDNAGSKREQRAGSDFQTKEKRRNGHGFKFCTFFIAFHLPIVRQSHSDNANSKLWTQ